MLLSAAIIIGALSLWYTNTLVKKLSEEEKKKVELWAEATKKLADLSDDATKDFNFLINVIRNNTTIPVIIADEKENIISSRNLDSLKMLNIDFAKKQLAAMRTQHEP